MSHIEGNFVHDGSLAVDFHQVGGFQENHRGTIAFKRTQVVRLRAGRGRVAELHLSSRAIVARCSWVGKQFAENHVLVAGLMPAEMGAGDSAESGLPQCRQNRSGGSQVQPQFPQWVAASGVSSVSTMRAIR